MFWLSKKIHSKHKKEKNTPRLTLQRSISLVNIKMCDQADLWTVPLDITLEWLWAPYQKHATPSNVILSFAGILHCPEQHINLSELDSIHVEKKSSLSSGIQRAVYKFLNGSREYLLKPSMGVGILLYFLTKGQEQNQKCSSWPFQLGFFPSYCFLTSIILTQPGHYYSQQDITPRIWLLASSKGPKHTRRYLSHYRNGWEIQDDCQAALTLSANP